MSYRENENTLEEKLLPYVLEKLGFSKLTKSEKYLIGEAQWIEREKDFTIIAQSFIRCLVNAQEKMTIFDIASTSLAEAYRVMEVTLANDINLAQVKPFHYTYYAQNYSDFHYLIKEEMHRWMLYLQEQGLLPGKYDQYTGTFRPAV